MILVFPELNIQGEREKQAILCYNKCYEGESTEYCNSTDANLTVFGRGGGSGKISKSVGLTTLAR